MSEKKKSEPVVFIKIQAKLLKFCEYWQSVFVSGIEHRLVVVPEKGAVIISYLDQGAVSWEQDHISRESKVSVCAAGYETAVLSYIDNLLGAVSYVIHKENSVVTIASSSKSSRAFVFPIEADPRPHQESYTIVVDDVSRETLSVSKGEKKI